MQNSLLNVRFSVSVRMRVDNKIEIFDYVGAPLGRGHELWESNELRSIIKACGALYINMGPWISLQGLYWDLSQSPHEGSMPL